MANLQEQHRTADAHERLKLVEGILGHPAHQGSHYAIYNMDCVEAMKQLPDELIDLTLTSPPYNIGKEYEKPLPLDQYVEWVQSWVAQIHRLTKSRGAFWLNLGYVEVTDRARALPLPYLIWDHVPFFLIQEVVWNYGAGVAARYALSPRNEKLLWYVKDADHYVFNLDAIRDPNVAYPNQKKNGKLRCNTAGKNPSDVWQIAKVTSGTSRSSPERTPHPAQFPLDLVDRVVRGTSNCGDLVLDPFMGSGSTAESCLRNGRIALGFETRADYCRVAGERLTNVQRELDSRLPFDGPATDGEFSRPIFG